jgi:hypothetical protein
LGSRVTTDLKDVTDINNWLRQAKGQAAALGTFFVQLPTHGWSDSSSLPSPWIQHSMALNLGHSMWNSADEYLPSTTPHHSPNHWNQHAPCCRISDQEQTHP